MFAGRYASTFSTAENARVTLNAADERPPSKHGNDWTPNERTLAKPVQSADSRTGSRRVHRRDLRPPLPGRRPRQRRPCSTHEGDDPECLKKRSCPRNPSLGCIVLVIGKHSANSSLELLSLALIKRLGAIVRGRSGLRYTNCARER